MFESTGNDTCKFVLNMLKELNFSDGQTMVKRVAVINARMDEGSSYYSSSGEIESVSDAAKIANMVMTGAGEE